MHAASNWLQFRKYCASASQKSACVTPPPPPSDAASASVNVSVEHAYAAATIGANAATAKSARFMTAVYGNVPGSNKSAKSVADATVDSGVTPKTSAIDLLSELCVYFTLPAFFAMEC